MSRFRAYKSTDGKWYVKTTDSNGLAGGPFDSPAEAAARAKRLAVLDAQADAAAAQPRARSMTITPGYRSPDVEDDRGAGPPASSYLPPSFLRWAKNVGTQPGQTPPRPGEKSPAAKHRIPIDPDEPVENWKLDAFDQWVRQPSEQTWGELMPLPGTRKP